MNAGQGRRRAPVQDGRQGTSGDYQFLLVTTNSSCFQAWVVSTNPASTPEWAEFSRALGMNLRRRRDALGLTQEAVAERAGISLYAYQQYERGAVTKGGTATNPRLATVLAVCQVLEASIADLLPASPRLR